MTEMVPSGLMRGAEDGVMVTPTRARSWKRRTQPRCACTPPRQCSTPLVVVCDTKAAVEEAQRRVSCVLTRLGLAPPFLRSPRAYSPARYDSVSGRRACHDLKTAW